MISLAGVTKRYKNKQVLGPLDLQIERGESVALIGGNGAGKSTTLRLIAGLLQPSAGSVQVAGETAGTKQAKQQLFYLPQKLALPGHLTMQEAVRLFVRLHRGGEPDVQVAAERYGLQAALTQRIGAFSGGMTQRLSLLLADVIDSPVLLLDEPTSNLDSSGVQLFMKRMKEWRLAGRTIVFATHAAAEINQLSTRTILLESGLVRVALETEPRPVRIVQAGEGAWHA